MLALPERTGQMTILIGFMTAIWALTAFIAFVKRDK